MWFCASRALMVSENQKPDQLLSIKSDSDMKILEPNWFWVIFYLGFKIIIFEECTDCV